MKTIFSKERFTNAIKKYLENHSQAQLAAASGVNQSALSKYLQEDRLFIDKNGEERERQIRHAPRADTLGKVAQAIGVPVTEFYEPLTDPDTIIAQHCC